MAIHGNSALCNSQPHRWQNCKFYTFNVEFNASRTAVASWSTQEVPFTPHWIPFSRSSIWSTVSPSQSAATPFVFPLHPPINVMLCTVLSSKSKSILWEQVPFVLYEYVIIKKFLLFYNCSKTSPNPFWIRISAFASYGVGDLLINASVPPLKYCSIPAAG